MNKSIEKYKPFFIVLHFVLIGLFITIILSIIKYFIDSISILEVMTAPLFISIMALVIGFFYCELKYYVKNVIFASIIFGIVSSQIFLLFLMIFFYFYDDIVRDIPPLDWYLAFTGLFSCLLIFIYIKTGNQKNSR